MARMMLGYPSIEDSWSTRNASKAVSVAKETMTQGAYKDMHRCMHFTNNWEECDGIEWSDKYLNKKVVAPDGVAHHRQKFCILKDAFNKR